MARQGGVGTEGSLRALSATPMFGRAEDQAQVLELLADPQIRLVSIAGRGGVGKTRLAVEVVKALEDEGRLPVHVVGLSGVPDIDLVVPTIAAVLEIPSLPNIALLEAIAHRLHHDEMVLVLDNFEHVLGAADAIDHLLGECPALTVLVTTQAPLKLRDERVLSLRTLPVPEPGADDVESLTTLPSVAAYCERAAAVDRQFVLDPSNAEAVADLCRALEGLPLAIELAAARAATLPAAEILRRFDTDQLSLMRRRQVGAPERHHDLRTAIEWTYRLLRPEEQHLFQRLSVFAGTFDLDAAAAMSEADDDADAFDALAALVDLHLVDPLAGTDPARFSMPSSIRSFAAEELQRNGDDEAARRCHVALRARQSRIAASGFDSTDERYALRMVAADHEDLFAALNDALDAEMIEEALDLVTGAAPLLDVRGYHTAHEVQLERALEMAAARDVVSVAHADALLWAALLSLRYRAGVDPQEPIERLRRGDAMARALGDERTSLRALMFWMLASPYTGDFVRALEAADEGLRLAADSPMAYWTGRFQVLAGMLSHLKGDEEEACALGVAALAVARELRDSHTIVLATMLLGPLSGKHPDVRAVMPTTAEALTLARETGLSLYEALLLPMLVGEAVRFGDHDQAVAWAVESLTLARSVPGSAIVGYNLLATMSLASARGDHDTVAYMHGVVRGEVPALQRTMAPEHVTAHGIIVANSTAALGAERFEAEARRGDAHTESDGIEAAITYVQAAATAIEDRASTHARVVAPEAPEALTERRRDVLRLLTEGLPNKEIATRLGVAPKTVMHHTTAIYRLLGVRGRSEAVAWAIRNGVVD